MSKNPILLGINFSEIYPDPLSLAAESALRHSLTDVALAGDMPASRLFSNLTASLERDIRGEMERERRDLSEGIRRFRG